MSVVVIGAGQAGLSAGYHLMRRGYRPVAEASDGDLSCVILDGDDGPGGAWQHRWRSLRMATVNGIFDLPGLPKPPLDPQSPSSEAVPRYFADFERRFDLPILRPVRVRSVRRADDHPDGRLTIETDRDNWSADAVINATGTWTNPRRPSYPGQETFAGRQLHTADYVSAEEFYGQHVVMVGGGISAVQLLAEISAITTTSWFTRREPVWLDQEFQPETTGRAVIANVEADVRRGQPPRSIVSYTGLSRHSSFVRQAEANGALQRRPMFTAIEPEGVRLADGGFQPADVIIWATGFRPALDHLQPLGLINEIGGIAMDGTAVAADPRVHLIGHGPSQSTVGANRAGRAAVTGVDRLIRRRESRSPAHALQASVPGGGPARTS
ncbi:oxidoreductase [Microlunatus endophyticus]|uniref:Oxidoreductase n=1 Tax=Microlunatus endophyticus TaxID=1716077 RepID=A0A917SIS8_9ACTN|nr:oxidoreductase [Microlunatus endophyticus]